MSAPSRDIRFVDADGVRLRIAISGTARRVPLLLITGIGASLDLAVPVRARAEPPRRPDDQLRRCLASASPRRTPGPGGCAASLARLSGCSMRSATKRSTCSASPSAVWWPSSSPTRRRPRVRRLVLAATGPGLGGVPGSPRVLWELATPAALPPARLLPASRRGRLRRRGAPGPGRAAARVRGPVHPSPSVRGYVGQLYPDRGLDQHALAARLRQPTLVLAGDDDPIVPLVNGRILAGSSATRSCRSCPAAATSSSSSTRPR